MSSPILRLLTTTPGLEVFLSTLQYSLYLLIYIRARAPTQALRARLSALLSKVHNLPRSASSSPAAPSGALTSPRLASLATLINDTRTTLRLTGLFPLYVWLRTLLRNRGSPNQDKMAHSLSLAQCSSLVLFQLLENIAVLTDRGVLAPRAISPPAFVSKLVSRSSSKPTTAVAGAKPTARLYLWSARFWLLGITFSLARLARLSYVEAQHRKAGSAGHPVRRKTKEEQDEADRKWWNDLVVCSCWFPIAINASLEAGMKGRGILGALASQIGMGILGLTAGSAATAKAWKDTESAITA